VAINSASSQQQLAKGIGSIKTMDNKEYKENKADRTQMPVYKSRRRLLLLCGPFNKFSNVLNMLYKSASS
jgi:hypothetical protein